MLNHKHTQSERQKVDGQALRQFVANNKQDIRTSSFRFVSLRLVSPFAVICHTLCAVCALLLLPASSANASALADQQTAELQTETGQTESTFQCLQCLLLLFCSFALIKTQ